MQNEHYYRQELENAIDSFIDKECMDSSPFSLLGDNISRLMSDAAFAVLQSSIDIQKYLEKEGYLKD